MTSQFLLFSFVVEEAHRRAAEVSAAASTEHKDEDEAPARPKRTFAEGPGATSSQSPATFVDPVPEVKDGQRQEAVYVPSQQSSDVDWVALFRGGLPTLAAKVPGVKLYLVGAAPDSTTPLHVLIVSDTPEQESQAKAIVEEILHDADKRRELQDAAATATESTKYHRGVSGEATVSGVADSNGLSVGADATEIMNVPNDKVGLIIGRKGDTIRQIQVSTGARVQIAKDSLPGASTREVTISGTPAQIAHARRAIQDTVDNPGAASSMGASHSERMQIPNNAVGKIIGPSGESIRQLQLRTGCIVQMQRDNEVPPGTQHREITLLGSLEQIAACRVALQETIQAIAAGTYQPPLSGAGPRGGPGGYGAHQGGYGGPQGGYGGHQGGYGGGYGGHQGGYGGHQGGYGGHQGGYGGPGGYGGHQGGYGGPSGYQGGAGPSRGAGGAMTETMMIPNDSVGLIIGRKGDTIRNIQTESGARIQIGREDGNPERPITINADSVQAIAAARQRILDVVSRAGSGPSGGGSGYGGYGGAGAGAGAGAAGYGPTAQAGGYGASAYGATAAPVAPPAALDPVLVESYYQHYRGIGYSEADARHYANYYAAQAQQK